MTCYTHRPSAASVEKLEELGRVQAKEIPYHSGTEERHKFRSLKDKLLISRNKLSAVFDSLLDPMLSLTPEGIVESINMALAKRAGAHPNELAGLSRDELLERVKTSPSTSEFLRQAFEWLGSKGDVQHRLITVPSKEGSEYWEVSLVPVRDDRGVITLIIIHAKDVTTFKRMEQTIREYSHSLEEMVAERTRNLLEAQDQLQKEKESLVRAYSDLRRLEVLRRDLTNMVVHDMKGPLAEVMGNLELLSFEPLSDTQAEALELAGMGADDLLRMTMNLLDIGRLEEGALQVNRGRVLFNEMAEAVCDKFRTLIRLKDIRVEIADLTASGLYADPDLLSRVLQNLLTNALAYTPEGGSVRIIAQDKNDGTVVEMADNGPGIAKHLQARIFRKFTQGHEHQRPRTSTGLGLTFCKLAVEAHGGDIWLESDEGAGARFYLWLPGEDRAMIVKDQLMKPIEKSQQARLAN
jgi:PAS domain S-box-containing protein